MVRIRAYEIGTASMEFTFLGAHQRRTVQRNQIECITGAGNYSVIHLANEKPVIVSFTLKKLERQLAGFIRIHKQTLINPHHLVSSHLKGAQAGYVVLSSGRTFNVARRKVDDLKTLVEATERNLPAYQSEGLP